MSFTEQETKILNLIQKDIVLCRGPFAAMAEATGLPENDIIAIIGDLKDRGIIRNIAGVFNAHLLGYDSSLVAFRVPDDMIDRAAEIINSHPGVSHNYLRDHDYNIWFTLSVEMGQDIDAAARLMAGKSGARDYILLRNERLIKIGLDLKIGDDSGGDVPSSRHIGAADSAPLDSRMKEAVRMLQNDMPLEKRPFRALAESTGSFLGEDDVIILGQECKRLGIMRRYSAVLRHRKAGYGSNAMTVWKPAGGDLSHAAEEIFRSEPAISHLYLRTLFPGRWEYPLFAMIHAKSDDELNDIISRLSRDSGISDYCSLKTVREFKKQRVRYFSEDFALWNARENI